MPTAETDIETLQAELDKRVAGIVQRLQAMAPGAGGGAGQRAAEATRTAEGAPATGAGTAPAGARRLSSDDLAEARRQAAQAALR